jgi:hypothetical protein
MLGFRHLLLSRTLKANLPGLSNFGCLPGRAGIDHVQIAGALG